MENPKELVEKLLQTIRKYDKITENKHTEINKMSNQLEDMSEKILFSMTTIITAKISRHKLVEVVQNYIRKGLKPQKDM